MRRIINKIEGVGGRAIFYPPPSKKMSECSICYDPVIDFPAPEGLEATGSHRSSCGHLFHPKCISKWHLRQEESTCPMCRKEATELEDCAPEESEAEEEEDEEYYYVGGVIRLSRAGLEFILRTAGGVGVTAGVEAEIQFDEFNEVVIERSELGHILQEQGGTPLSDAQWTQLTSVYPPAEYNDDEEGPMVPVAPPRWSITPVCPHAFVRCGPRMRASMSVAPPVGKPTTMRIGLLG